MRNQNLTELRNVQGLEDLNKSELRDMGNRETIVSSIRTRTDRAELRLSATLLFVGVLISVVAGLFHPAHATANDHPAAFAEYAASTIWIAVHLAQFIGMAVIIAGLLVLDAALDQQSWTTRLGALFALIALALYGVLQAVDGVALKRAVDAWVAAPEAEKAARFASAETVRWLEWGAKSYQTFILGTSLFLFAMAILRTGFVSKPIGYLMGLSGVAYVVQGWILGLMGFGPAEVPTVAGILLNLVWSIWFLVFAWKHRTQGTTVQE
jgi:hypothetical protein